MSYQGYGGGGYSSGSGGGWGQQQQQQQAPMYNTNQFAQPQQGQQQQQQQQAGNTNQWQYSQQNNINQQQQGGFGQPQQQQQPQQGSFGQPHGGGGYGQAQGGGGMYGQQPQGGGGMYGQQQQGYGQQQQAGLFNNAFVQQAALSALTNMATGGGQNGLANIAPGIFPGQGVFPVQPPEQINKIFTGVLSFMNSLRYYFAVDNRYVLQKMKRVLFPFLTKHWKRNMKGNTGPDAKDVLFDTPVDDENAPDLYIPSMSLITYVLLCALCYGNAGQFDPEVIPDVCTKCFLANVVEVLIIRVGFYMMQTNVPFLDLMAYTGYKYLGLCINMLVGLMGRVLGVGGATAYYVCFVWTALASAYLMLKIMSHTVPMQVAADGPRRDVMVLAFAAGQPVFMWFVTQTKFL